MHGLPPTTEWRTVTFLDGVRFDIAIDTASPDLITQVYAEGRFPHSPYSTLLPHLLRPGMAVLDLGAHVGSFALVAAALGCRVLAVEACPWNVALLYASVQRNGFTNLQVVEAAVSDQPGTVDFCPHGPFGLVAYPGLNAASLPVRAARVDDLLVEAGWTRVDLIKLDVEGSEVAAVHGMHALLSRADAPPLIYESNGHTLHLFGQTPKRLKGALERFGYRNYLIEPSCLVPERAEDLQASVVTDNLASKQRPALPAGWRMRSRLSPAETVARLVAAAASADVDQRVHMARSLKEAPAALLTDPLVRATLAELCHDGCAEVRETARSAVLPPRPTWTGWLKRWWQPAA
jgi:FkbM family methyltransferase